MVYSQIRPLDFQLNLGRYAKEDQFNGFTPELILYKNGRLLDYGISTQLVHKSYSTFNRYNDVLNYPINTNVLIGEGALTNEGISKILGNLSQYNSRFFTYNFHVYLGHTFFPSRKFNLTISVEPGISYVDYLDIIGVNVDIDETTGEVLYLNFEYGAGRGLNLGAKFRTGVRYNFSTFYLGLNYCHAQYTGYILGTFNFALGIPVF